MSKADHGGPVIDAIRRVLPEVDDAAGELLDGGIPHDQVVDHLAQIVGHVLEVVVAAIAGPTGPVLTVTGALLRLALHAIVHAAAKRRPVQEVEPEIEPVPAVAS